MNLLEMRGIRKSFPGVRALDGVSFDLRPGEVHVLLGENGAGKSTLIKVLAGALQPDAGEIRFEGRAVRIDSPATALRLGINAIYQEFNLVPGLTVAQNVFLGRELRRAGAWLDRAAMERRTREILAQFGVRLDPAAKVESLGVAQKQMVELAKALTLRCRVLVLDEPTAALSPAETERLFTVIERLAGQGVGVIYISHRLDEIHRVGQRATVLKDGAVAGVFDLARTEVGTLIEAMVGRKLGRAYPAPSAAAVGAARPPRLRVEGLSRPPAFMHVNLHVDAGEIVGLAGLVGAGRTELARALFGVDRPHEGRVWVNGLPASIRSPADAIRRGIALLSEDRGRFGLCLPLPVRQNIAHAALAKLFPWLIATARREEALARGFVDRLRIATPDVERPARALSGGNQQKVVLAKWLATGARLLIFDEPTRGVDVGAKSEIHQLIRGLAEGGAGVIVISSDVEEVAGLSDRVYVMRGGRMVAELRRPSPAGAIAPADVLAAAVGEGWTRAG